MSTKSASDIPAWLKATERELARAGAAKRVSIFRRLNALIDRVWTACTDRKQLRLWFADVDGDLQVGSTVTLDVGAGCKLTSTILHCTPPHKLVVTWSYPGRQIDEIELRLTPDGDGTHLELAHRFG